MAKFGYIYGDRNLVPFPMGNTGEIKEGWGVIQDSGANGNVMAAADSGKPFGMAAEHVSAPTNDGDTEIKIDISEESVYRIPVVAGTLATTMLGKTCDYGVVAGVHGADVSASTDDVFMIVGLDITGDWVEVKLYGRLNATGVV